ncbi:aldo/keto reductase [Deinococcus irradiatisoli]|uniref:Aldo/keto reductase n=1 Tax=Deinococcus irradiatisoli TaxID=2202254 RepID=A0A2Z3JG81_9DEIO|nr:aldo/keto reductase [Deinococcus irradiatisoli]AWN23975.1 aldo/keto reductase [Deinococcus irradiatisoli]
MSAELGLGLAALGRPEYINLGRAQDLPAGRSVDDLRRRSHAMLDLAWAAGLRMVDTARSYGLAEQFLGEWLARYPERRSALWISSKWGYTYVANWQPGAEQHEVKDHSLANFERQWPQTLAALGGPPDLYLIHSVTPQSPALQDSALLGRLDQLARQGVEVGLSVSGPQQSEVIQAALALGGPFQAVQATWNVLEPSAAEALAQAKEADWRVVIKEALANGRLTDRGAGQAGEEGTTLDALALAAALAQPWADIVLSGAVTAGQLESNLRARQLANSALPTALLALRETPEVYWRRRAGLPWQ